MMKPVTTRLEDEVIGRLEGQAHASGYSSPSQFMREILTEYSLRDVAEIPASMKARQGPDVLSEFPLSSDELSREGTLPGETVESLIHRLFPPNGGSQAPNPDEDRVFSDAKPTSREFPSAETARLQTPSKLLHGAVGHND